MAEMIQFSDGKKFVWDGEEYETKQDAAVQEEKYKENNFEVRSVSKGGKVFLYTRRVVTEVVVDGA